MATGDQNDMFNRLRGLLPRGWFGDSTPVLDALLSGLAQGLSWFYTLYDYAKQQTRLKTATGGWLDLIAQDFFGTTLRRTTGQSDTQFRNRISINLFREKSTRHAVESLLEDLTGRTARVVEPRRPMDTGIYAGQEVVGFSQAPSIYLKTWNGVTQQYATPRTNFLLYSNTFANAVWAAARWGGAATITDGDTTYVAPDGGLTTSKVVATTGGSGVGQAVTLTAGVTYTFSVWVLSPASAANVVIKTSSGATGAVVSTPVAASSSWGRYSVTYTPTVTQVYYLGVVDAVALQTYWIWQAQLEAGQVATTPIPTTSATVTVTDYVLSGNTITFASAPASNTPVLWSGSGVGTISGTAQSASMAPFSLGDGVSRVFSVMTSYQAALGGYSSAGAYGSLLMPYQAFVTAYRPTGTGFPYVAGYGISTGGYHTGSQAVYESISAQQTVSDSDIYAAIDAVKPAGTEVWVQIAS